MNAREITNQYRESRWIQLFAERNSGETVNKFCERNEISRAQFFYWQRKLRKSACSEIEEAPQSWALCVQSPPPEQSEIIVEVGGCRIAVNSDTDEKLFARVCRTLKAL
ncbi:MAG: hypothetical protein FWG44_07765 [Oscillospiraceae bacterium]|nr:hypothetical protein [Oscillospiraceae bacterium]